MIQNNNDTYCDCISIEFDSTTIEQLVSGEVNQLFPQPDPNCVKCKGTGYIIGD